MTTTPATPAEASTPTGPVMESVRLHVAEAAIRAHELARTPQANARGIRASLTRLAALRL